MAVFHLFLASSLIALSSAHNIQVEWKKNGLAMYGVKYDGRPYLGETIGHPGEEFAIYHRNEWKQYVLEAPEVVDGKVATSNIILFEQKGTERSIVFPTEEFAKEIDAGHVKAKFATSYVELKTAELIENPIEYYQHGTPDMRQKWRTFLASFKEQAHLDTGRPSPNLINDWDFLMAFLDINKDYGDVAKRKTPALRSKMEEVYDTYVALGAEKQVKVGSRFNYHKERETDNQQRMAKQKRETDFLDPNDSNFPPRVVNVRDPKGPWARSYYYVKHNMHLRGLWREFKETFVNYEKSPGAFKANEGYADEYDEYYYEGYSEVEEDDYDDDLIQKVKAVNRAMQLLKRMNRF